jgi:hypothetical protein
MLKASQTALKVFFCFFSTCSSGLLVATSPKPDGSVQTKPYVIGSLLGQLGNRMFEVATAYAVAWDNNADAYFPDFTPNPDYAHIFFRCKIIPPSSKVEFEWATSAHGYQPIPFHPNMRISGYCQSEKYFLRYRDRILKLFAPRKDDLKYIKRKYNKILDHQNSVSVHLRYYYAEKPNEDQFIQYDREYFEKAMSLFPKDSLFVVTSDNIEFARRNIPTDRGEVIFIEHEPFYIDFFLQSLCKHNIISNSTFSWWSAWLNQNPSKIVVRPRDWIRGEPDIGGPDEWIKIDAMGMQERTKRQRTAP